MKKFYLLLLLGTILLRPAEFSAQEKLGEFLGGCLLTAVVILPSNPYPDNVSYPRYALGTIGGIIGVKLTGKFVFRKEGSTAHAIWGRLLGGVVGSLFLHIIKISYTREKSHGNPVFRIDLTPIFDPLFFSLIIIPPAFGATSGYNQQVQDQKALIKINCSQFILNFPKIIFSTRRDYFKNPYGIYQCRIFEFEMKLV